MAKKSEEHPRLGERLDGDAEEPDFEGKTEAGGWWSAENVDRRADPRVTFTASVELIPPDGNVHECEGVNLSMGGVLLRKTNPGSLPGLGQMLVLEINGDGVHLDAVVVRVEHEHCRFAVQVVNLEAGLRGYLEGKVNVEVDDETETSYSNVKKKP